MCFIDVPPTGTQTGVITCGAIGGHFRGENGVCLPALFWPESIGVVEHLQLQPCLEGGPVGRANGARSAVSK